MGKHKSAGKDKSKNGQLLIRVDKSEREAFVTMCETLDTSAAREIRRFMREFVGAHAGQAIAEQSQVSAAADGPQIETLPEPVTQTEPEPAAASVVEPVAEQPKPRKTRSRAAA